MTKRTISDWLSDSKTRAWLHAVVLLIAAAVALAIELGFDIAANAFPAPDKKHHFQIGRIISAICFLLAYSCILVRVFLSQSKSITRALLWVPAFLALGVLFAISVTMLLAFAKEAIDLGGLGKVEWEDINATLYGALTMVPAVSIVMILTPLFIPFDILMQLPRLMRSDLRTGFGGVDQYIKARKETESTQKGADVLIVEDDIACATVAMNFCRHLKFTCHHVSSIDEADEYLRLYQASIRLILLDNFLRVGQDGTNTTGAEWIERLREEIPREQQRFLVVLISGHTSMLRAAENYVDMVMQKPWSPAKLLAFLQERGVVRGREKA